MTIKLVTQKDVADATGRARQNIRDSYRRGLLPKPDFTINADVPLWLPETIKPYIERMNEK